jgi:hypothetical protein
LIVSCQIPAQSPLLGKVSTASLALAAESGGAVAIRAQGFDSIKGIKEAVSIPVIGLIKTPGKTSGVYINSTIAEVRECVAAGSDYIAIDATGRPRADFADLAEFVVRIVDKRDLVGTFHASNSGSASWYDLARMTFELNGKDPSRVLPIKSSEYPQTAKRPPYSVLSLEKWRSVGIPPMQSWQDALFRTFQISKQNKEMFNGN